MKKITFTSVVFLLWAMATYAQTPCTPVSPLDCSNIPVALPLNLDFNAAVPNTVGDTSSNGTGFTMILEHSEARRSDDLPISDSQINGYEPSLLNLTGGVLQMSSQGGIAYLDPPASSLNNNQVNTLGVGLVGISSLLTIETKLSNIVTGGGASQAGIWFGFDEDNFVKLVVNNSIIELRVESGGTSGTTDQASVAVGASGNDVILELEIDPTALTATGYYTIGSGSRSQLTSKPVPANYFTGRSLGGTDMSFAGIFLTDRGQPQFTASFDYFNVDGQVTTQPGGGGTGSGLWSQGTSNTIYYNSGNVGIGTTDPGSWELAVDGKIRSREVRVDSDVWPDYVFEEDYELPTLEEVARHIQRKGHLINMPSANEIETNGLALGEMNKLLLEKIEELTLYILQLEKRIDTIEKQEK
ncbi:MAG: hypothetical protein AAF361_06150 [Bacteroidota bacterium]